MNAVTIAPMQGALSTKFAPPVKGQSANDLAGGITGGYGLIGYRGKVWSIRYKNEEVQLMRDDGDGPRGSIDVVILKANPHLSKNWYENGYVEGSNAPPDCSSANGIIPDQGVPKKQSNVCKTCPKNAWGSATGGSGKGKACGDHRRMAVVPLADLENTAYGGPLLLRCPAASLQDLAGFSQKLEQLGYPYYAVGVKIGFDPQESFPKFTFTGLRPLNDAEADIVLRHRDTAEVQRVISEEQPDAAAIAAAEAADANTQKVDPSVAAIPPKTPPVTPPPPVQTAPVKATGFGPAATPAATAAPAETQQPVQQVQAAAPIEQVPVAETAKQPVKMTGFGPTTAPAPAAQPSQGEVQSFPGAADGTKTIDAAANTAFEADLDTKLKDLLG